MEPKILRREGMCDTLVNIHDSLRTCDHIAFFGAVSFISKEAINFKSSPSSGFFYAQIGNDEVLPSQKLLFEMKNGKVRTIFPIRLAVATHRYDAGKFEMLDPKVQHISDESARALLRCVGKSIKVKITSRWDSSRKERLHSYDVSDNGNAEFSHRDFYLAFLWDEMLDSTLEKIAQRLQGHPFWEEGNREAIRQAARRLGLKKLRPPATEVWKQRPDKE